MRRRRVILGSVALAGALIVVACQGDRVEQTFEGPVRIENVQYYGPRSYCSCKMEPTGAYPRLVVHDDVKFEITSYCTNATIKQHGPKKLIALYCPTVYGPDFEEWRIFRRLGGGRYLEDCKSKGATPPDLDAVKPLAEVATTIIGCTYGLQKSSESGNEYMAKRYKLVAEELSKSGGPEAISQFLEMTLDEPMLFYGREDGWVTEASRLEPGARAALLGRLCSALSRGDSSDTAYARAARMCPLDADAVKDAALARLKSERKSDGDPVYKSRPWALAIAARGRPKEAGALLCAEASKPEVPSDVLVALRASGVKCPGAARALAATTCGDAPDDAGCGPIDDTIRSWGSELTTPPPRPIELQFPHYYPVICAMKREYDAGSCRSSYDAPDAADASSGRDR